MRESKKLRLLCLAALFAGAIAVTTAYLLHIPIPHRRLHPPGRRADLPGGLSAGPPPTPWAPPWWGPAGGSAHRPSVGGPHAAHQGHVALLFTSRAPRLLCPRNGAALLLACLLSPAAYGLAACLLLGGVNAFWPQFLGTLVQAVGSGAVFTVLGAGPGPGGR